MFLPKPTVPGSWNEFPGLSILGERGLLQYTRHLSITFPRDPEFAYGLEPNIQHLRTITNLWILEAHWLDTFSFIPKMGECFGSFLGTLQSLKLAFARGQNKRILYFVCLFPNLRDLEIYSVHGYINSMRNDGPCFDIKTSPPLDCTFDLQWNVASERDSMGAHLFLSDLVALPSGLKFRTLKLSECTSNNLQLLVNACAPTLECMEFTGRRFRVWFLHGECPPFTSVHTI